MKTSKYARLLSGFLAVVMLFSLLPVSALAAEVPSSVQNITWYDEDGVTVLAASQADSGSVPAYPDSLPLPQKAEDETYTYVFAGWNPEPAAVTEDTSYQAVYTAVEKTPAPTYTIFWMNWDGELLEMDEAVAEGAVPEYNGDTPVHPADEQNTYTFSGWDPAVAPVTGEITYTAQFTSAPVVQNTYAVYWMNWDGELLEMDEAVAEGAVPEYNGDTPVRPADEQNTYTFSGWDPAVAPVTGEITYTAQFTSAPVVQNTYTVIWMDWNGDVLEMDEAVEEGTVPEYNGTEPFRPEDEQYTYTFSGWDPVVAPVTGEITYTAQYQSAEKVYVPQPVVTYEDFLADLKILETYADTYAADNGKKSVDLVLNFIRTGVEKYNEGLWVEAAGAEETAFVAFVAQQDELNKTSAAALRDLPADGFAAPNGQDVEFEHMFGAMDMGWHNPNNADMGSWAGDLVDLMEYSFNHGVTGTTLDEKADYIRTTHLGVDAPGEHSFGILDIYGDLDACYFLKQLKDTGKALSELMEAYYPAVTDADRAAAFVNARFPGSDKQETLRENLFTEYSANGQIKLLEAARNLDTEAELRQATCYAFADYLFQLADGKITPVDPPVDPDKPTDPVVPEEDRLFNVFASSHSHLAPGVEQDIKKAMTKDDKQIVYYIATVDPSSPNIDIYANYKDNDGSQWGFSPVLDQAMAAQKKHSDPSDPAHYIENYTPIVATNADFYDMSTAEPTLLVMEGVIYKENTGAPFFGVLDDGTPIIGDMAQWNLHHDHIREAVAGGTFLVKDGKATFDLSKNDPNGRASRTCIGLTAEGKVVMMVLDGRQEPFSTGGTYQELCQIMLDAGCVTALNLDGGGSTTFVAKPEGASSLQVINRPSDGNARSVASSVLVVSHAAATTDFDHAVINTEYDYLSVGSEIPVSYFGVSSSGNEAQIPEGAVLKSSDDAIGTVTEVTVDGTTVRKFTAKALGDAELQVVAADGTVLGTKVLHIVAPDGVEFRKGIITAIYGQTVPMPVNLTFNGNRVVANGTEIRFELDKGAEAAGTFQGLSFTAGPDTCGIRTVRVTAVLLSNPATKAAATINLYKDGEATFNFEQADNAADPAKPEKLAWNRTVTNSIKDNPTEENPVPVYHLADPTQSMEVSYVFALDMNALEIPPKIQEALPILAQFMGVNMDDVTAWELMLMLAERISPSSQVKVTVNIDPEMQPDFTNLVMLCECFELSGFDYDEATGEASILCSWIKRDGPLNKNTVSPLCTISGIRMAAKPDAEMVNNTITVDMGGNIHYDARIRSSQAYNIAGSQMGQQYGLYQYDNTANLVNDRGAGFESDHCSFTDKFVLDYNVRNGWVQVGSQPGELAYYADNVRKTDCIEKLPAQDGSENQYYYEFDSIGICRGKYTGFLRNEEGIRYIINGELKTGWRLITDETDGKDYDYYFDPVTGLAVDGEQTIDDFHYIFENNRLVKGDLRLNTYNYDKKDPRFGKPVYQYRWAGLWKTLEWVSVDGKTIFFDHRGWAKNNVFRTYNKYEFYLADEYGAVKTDYTGLYHHTHKDGTVKTYYCVEGKLQANPGLVLIEGYYYYFASNGAAVKDCDYWPTITNGLVPENRCYHFDEQGRMTNPPTNPDNPDPEKPNPDPDKPDPEVPAKNGLIEEDGKLVYYADGQPAYAGLIKIGEDYYYIRSNCQAVQDRTYWVTKHNGLLPETEYKFGPDGKMINPPVVNPDPEPPTPEIKNGIVEEDGALWYYENNKRVPAGLILLDGCYYYVRSNGQVVQNRSYWTTAHNNLLPEGLYEFGPDGKMLNPPVVNPDPPVPEVRNGVVEEDGKLWYYENDRKVPAGLVKIGDDYYYARTSTGEIIRGRSYWVTKTNDLLPAGSYQFGPDGKMIQK